MLWWISDDEALELGKVLAVFGKYLPVDPTKAGLAVEVVAAAQALASIVVPRMMVERMYYAAVAAERTRQDMMGENGHAVTGEYDTVDRRRSL